MATLHHLIENASCILLNEYAWITLFCGARCKKIISVRSPCTPLLDTQFQSLTQSTSMFNHVVMHTHTAITHLSSFTHAHIHTHAHSHNARAHTHTRAHSHTYTRAHTHSHTLSTRAHTHTHTHTRAQTHSHKLSLSHSHSLTHSLTHTYTHTAITHSTRITAEGVYTYPEWCFPDNGSR